MGHRPLSAASPNKTVEGLVGGMGLRPRRRRGLGRHARSSGPWTGAGAALVLGLGAALAAPLGDLCQSLLKRDLGVKDMGVAAARPRRRARPLRRHAVRAAHRVLARLWPSATWLIGHLAAGPMTTTVALAGSTGSIGTQTLDVVAAEPDRFEVVALGRQRSQPRPAGRPGRGRPAAGRGRGRRVGGRRRRRAACPASRCAPAPTGWPASGAEADVCVNGVVGFAGLEVTLATLLAGRAPGPGQQGVAHRRRPGGAAGPAHPGRRAGAGRQRARRHPPVPAVARRGRPGPGRTAWSSPPAAGPFRGRSRDDLAAVTIEDALAHPTWSHGPEDHGRLVDADEQGPRGHRGPRAVRRPGRATPAWASATTRSRSWCTRSRSSTRWSTTPTAPPSPSCRMPDMRLPIGYALAWPDRIAPPVRRHRLDRRCPGSTSSRPTSTPSRACGLAYEAGRAGGLAPAWLNAANEEAVAAFLDGRIAWVDIAAVCAAVLDRSRRRDGRRRRGRDRGRPPSAGGSP